MAPVISARCFYAEQQTLKMKNDPIRLVPAGLPVCSLAMLSANAFSQSPSTSDPTDAGKAVFKRANCFGCHKWHGNGGGGYGGDALSLRKTELNREQIMETVFCGRPGSGLHFITACCY